MLSHFALECKKESRPCPLASVGCKEVAGHEDAAAKHTNLLLKARLVSQYPIVLLQNARYSISAVNQVAPFQIHYCTQIYKT